MSDLTVRAALPVDVQNADFVRNEWVVTVDSNVTKEDILRPEFWVHTANKFKPLDLVEVRPRDGSFYGEFIVLSVGANWVRLHTRGFHDLTKLSKMSLRAIELTREQYEIKHVPTKGWIVLRLTDKQIVHDNAQTEADANEWLNKFLRNAA